MKPTTEEDLIMYVLQHLHALEILLGLCLSYVTQV